MINMNAMLEGTYFYGRGRKREGQLITNVKHGGIKGPHMLFVSDLNFDQKKFIFIRSVYFKVKNYIKAATKKKSAKRPKKTLSNFDNTKRD